MCKAEFWNRKKVRPITCEVNCFVKRHKLEDTFVVMYSGDMELGSDLDTLAQTAEKFRNYNDIIFVFISKGSQSMRLQELSEKWNRLICCFCHIGIKNNYHMV